MINLSALAQKLDGELMGGDIAFSQLSTDSRTLSHGDMYLALNGDRFDGNDFVVEAITKGASGAIVSKELDIDCPMLRVPDTHAALGEIAKLNRQRSSAKVIALTGSQGKTTVKEMIHRMLSNQASTLVTHANLNNTIGVPLTLLQLNEKHEFAVIEMGANRAGEIAFSADKALPNIALITNASSAHIEGFGSLQGIVEAKGEIIDGVSPQGTVILNLMDPNANQWIERAKSRRVVLFSACNSSNGPAEYFASNVLKEFNIGILNGIIFAVISAIVVQLWFDDIKLSMIISISMILNMIVAGLFGILVPVALKKMKIDPAIASSVFVTTITDVIGFLSFLGVGAYFFYG